MCEGCDEDGAFGQVVVLLVAEEDVEGLGVEGLAVPGVGGGEGQQDGRVAGNGAIPQVGQVHLLDPSLGADPKGASRVADPCDGVSALLGVESAEAEEHSRRQLDDYLAGRVDAGKGGYFEGDCVLRCNCECGHVAGNCQLVEFNGWSDCTAGLLNRLAVGVGDED